MTGCHDCAVADEIARGEYENAEWNDVPCSTCKFSMGGFAIEFDENRLSDDAGESKVIALDMYDRTVMPVAVMKDLVVGLLKLPPGLRDVVSWRFAGLSYPEIADALCITVAAAEKRHRRALALWPELKAMFAEKVAKQKRRKKHAA